MSANKTLYGVIGVVIVAAIGGGVYWYMQSQNSQMANSSSNGSNASPQGRVVFSVTDASTAIQNVSSVQMTVSQVQMHSNTQGWVTVSTKPKEFDLLQLKASNEVAVDADSNIAADSYDQVRMHIDHVTVVKSGVAEQAVLPSQDITFNSNVNVRSSATASVKLDIIANESLYTTSRGQFIFAPVVAVETRSNSNVQVASDGSVVINGGTIDASISVGMNLTGTMQPNFILNTVGGVQINNGVINLQGSGSANANGSTTTTNTQGGASNNINTSVGGTVKTGLY